VTTIALGVFDGVHRGHQLLIEQARAIADANNESLLAVSFAPHPAQILAPEHFLGLLSTAETRRELLLAAGADEVDFVAFDTQLAEYRAEQFASEFIVEKWRGTHVVVGQNFRFGTGARAGVNELAALGLELGFSVSVVALLEDQSAVSSSRIRKLLREGQVDEANSLLGRLYEIRGKIVRGHQRGRELGFPTANLETPTDLLIPGDGVYAAWVEIDASSFPAAVSIGTNPTFDDVLATRVEGYLLDQSDLDLYGKIATFRFVAQIRPMRKFADLSELIAAMTQDVAQTREILG
jgi:riboflavin kinase/FMN adenylyltransferase